MKQMTAVPRLIAVLVALAAAATEQASAATYVVDQAAPRASDTNPGTEEQPFKSIQHATDLIKPGDTVLVMAGKYGERVKVRTGGTEGQPITLRGMPRRSVVVAGFDLQASYLCVEGFEITADKPATAVQLEGSYCEVADNYIHDMMVGVAGTVGKRSLDGNTRDYSAVAHNRVAYNKVYHSQYGFMLGGEDWLVENNEVSRLFMYTPGNRYDDCDYSRFFGKGCVQRYNYYHGSTSAEIRVAHVDCLQTFTVNGEIAHDMVFEHNTCFDFHQMCMVESAPHIGSVRGWTFRGNIMSANSPTMSGGWGPDIIQTPDVTIANNTISTVRWACIGLRGQESTNGQIRNNILCHAQRAVDDTMDFTPAKPAIAYNLTFQTAPVSGEHNLNGKDPLFVDAPQRNFRLRQGSPAIAAGQGGVTIGALEFPSVYYVDPRHPAATDEPAWGYPAVPLASLVKACAIARPGETIVLRAGVYREVLAPANDGVTVRAMKGETVTISGADLIEGWKCEIDGRWSARLPSEPRRVLRDGQPWHEFSYDRDAKQIVVKSDDPRLHVFETIVRDHVIDLNGKKNVKLEGITAVNTSALQPPPIASAFAARFDAPKLFEQSVTDHLRLSEAQDDIELEVGELFEDDGPASGHSYLRPNNREVVTTQQWIKKELLIPNPQARAAYLVVLSEEPFEALINGVAQQFGENQSGRRLYRTYAFDPHILQTGRNEIILRKSGRVLIARDNEFALGSRAHPKHPNRSAKSTDAGKTWDYDHLGPEGQLDGEYGVRLFLDHYCPQGSLTMPVIDVGNLEAKAVGASITQTGPIKVTVGGEAGPAGSIVVRVRSGDTYVPSAKRWSDWQTVGPTGGVIETPRGRYVQVGLVLSTRDPLQSPRLKSVRVEARPVCPDDWTARIHVLEAHNESIVRTSIPFEYEPLDHARLKKLREEHKLDEVVQGAQGELELMLRLAQWACNSWDWPNHIAAYYPPWDALEILRPYEDGKPTGGFCLQFNLVFLQACESFGLTGRAVSISQGRWQEKYPGGGHEIVEIWSNEWKKWVYVDGALAWYIVDPKTGTPLSVWELRQRQLPTLRAEPVQEVRIVDAVRTKNKQFVWNGLSGPKPLNWYLELRMIPRSNFLQEQSPLPLNQGTEEWSWTGHYVWSDAEVPAGYLFGHRVSKRANFEWTLNQAHYVLEPANEAGSLRVHLDTETPSFETFLAEIDAREKKSVSPGFVWTLHPGKNRLRVWPRNVAGREGIPSWITVDYR